VTLAANATIAAATIHEMKERTRSLATLQN
jgi:hypothetical protein